MIVNRSQTCQEHCAALDHHDVCTFSIQIVDGLIDEPIANIPFAGTLEEAEREAERLTGYFSIMVYANIQMWFEYAGFIKGN